MSNGILSPDKSYIQSNQREAYIPSNQRKAYIPGNQHEAYIPGNQREAYIPGNQRDSFNTFTQSKNPFTPFNQNGTMTPSRAFMDSSQTEKAQDKQKEREHTIDNLPFAMLTKSKPSKPDEPVYVVILIAKRNK